MNKKMYNKTKACLKIEKIACLTIRLYENKSKDFKVIIIMYIQKKSIKLH